MSKPNDDLVECVLRGWCVARIERTERSDAIIEAYYVWSDAFEAAWKKIIRDDENYTKQRDDFSYRRYLDILASRVADQSLEKLVAAFKRDAHPQDVQRDCARANAMRLFERCTRRDGHPNGAQLRWLGMSGASLLSNDEIDRENAIDRLRKERADERLEKQAHAKRQKKLVRAIDEIRVGSG